MDTSFANEIEKEFAEALFVANFASYMPNAIRMMSVRLVYVKNQKLC